MATILAKKYTESDSLTEVQQEALTGVKAWF
jgi:hypothetical protein